MGVSSVRFRAPIAGGALALLLLSGAEASRAKSEGEACRPLRNGWCAPVGQGVLAGYVGDTGLDILADRAPVFAVAGGTLEYAERGHTRWTSPPDTPLSARVKLDTPMITKQCTVTNVYYARMSALALEQAEGAPSPLHLQRGVRIGTTGIGNRVPHLHIGLLLRQPRRARLLELHLARAGDSRSVW